MANCGRRTEIEFSIAIRVYFQDTDAGEVVYHGTYLNFLERARTEWLRHLGFEQHQLKRRFGVLFIVRGMELKFVRPARLDDLVDVSVAITQVGRAQVTLAQEVSCGDATLVRASVNLACVESGNFRPQPLPKEIGAAFSNATDTNKPIPTG
ncbi:MAG: tol-pal system-associated acyl-CoA thioesterase [Betaproteobacteria bacterium]|nr:MAG: tol-pal system-associated acyl-CoA thioesterase [Betaproteobacteria bacterium]